MNIVLTVVIIVVVLVILCFLQAHEIDKETEQLQKELEIVNFETYEKLYHLYNFNNVVYDDIYNIIKKNGSNTNN